ncbi:pimeloyl-ACP methyl ester carboxylesterase [Agromyces terreus]|uniref:Pimeloyl-ACP methyl ester carboxylesterase n=1 Tax=Agromyces terreus TaxID=424795 RepID=A0A9X2GWN8_9MICO|nr:alpha/beta hydrolase [Agromyces terreus]MCP2370440.1 pimeloyl-ACP methyl ester carboxylesterase [Agromyces terreus]
MQTFPAADGTELAFSILGGDRTERAPTLVVPGGPCRGVDYLEDLAGIADIRPLAVLHPRGTPTSGGRSRGWWADADDLIALADHLGLERFDVIGHSAGTRLVLAASARFPDRLRRSALVTPAAAWLTDAAWDGAAIGGRRGDPAVILALESLTGPQPVDQRQWDRARALEAPAGYAAWTDRERAHSMVGGWDLAAVEAWFTGVPDDATARILAAPRIPALVVGGAGDILSGVAPVEAYAAALGADLRMIPECGHYPWVEQPAAFREALGGWLAD